MRKSKTKSEEEKLKKETEIKNKENEINPLKSDLNEKYKNLKSIFEKKLKHDQESLPEEIKYVKNSLQQLKTKIEKLFNLNLKKQTEIKQINDKVSEKYNCQKINLNYTGAYSEDGLDVVIKEKGKLTKGKDIIISKDTLNNAITNLANYDNKQNENIKNDLVRLIFITSEAMRFQCDEKTLEIFANIKNIDELKKIIANSKNILKDIKEKIFNKNQTITWSEYTTQLRGNKKEFDGWKDYSEMLNKFRIEIWEELIKIIKVFNKLNNFIRDKNIKNNIQKEINKLTKNNINEILISFRKQVENYTPNDSKKEKFNREEIEFILKFIELIIENKLENKSEFFDILNENIKIDYILPIWSVLNNNLDITKLLIILNPTIIKNTWFSSTSLLHLAVFYNYKSIVKFLLDSDADINIKDKEGFTPLHYAAKKGYTEVVKELLNNLNSKNKINVNNNDNKEGFTPLHLAIQEGHFEVVKELLNNPDININDINNQNNTPLHIAAFYGHTVIVKELLTNENSKNKIDVNKPNKDGARPLHYAAQEGHHPYIVKLLLENGADVNASDKAGNISLHYAAKRGNLYTIKLLLDNGSDPNYQNNNVHDPLYIATDYKKTLVINLLKEFNKLNKKINICNNLNKKN